MGKLLTVKDVVAKLAISPATVYRLMNRGELKPIKIGRALRFDEADIEAYIQRLKGESESTETP